MKGSIIRDKVPGEIIESRKVPILTQGNVEDTRIQLADRISLIAFLFKGNLNEDGVYQGSADEMIAGLADLHSMIVALAELEGLDIDDLRTSDLVIKGATLKVLNRIMLLGEFLYQETTRVNRLILIGQIYSLLLTISQNLELSLRDLEKASNTLTETQGGFNDGLILLDVLKPSKTRAKGMEES
jgi:hypothetical protein